MQPAGPLFHKPKSIIAAINILYASLFFDISSWVIGQFTFAQTAGARIEAIVVLLLTLLIIFFLIRQIAAGKKWARIVILVLTILGLAGYLWALPVLFKTNLLLAVISLLQAVLQILALVYLFSKDSTNWFDHVGTFKRNEMVPTSKPDR